ncbi:hypothetical protein MUK42_18888 [Musa troglodytarum]|uniref:Uncharacterized protein n=1 Tax=Musa troglodytarum TaxID=320322 RepID=A0A9E7HBW4_9LILI|nr:hypothetical protein MUK42_18888 [Musa troglodytarum]
MHEPRNPTAPGNVTSTRGKSLPQSLSLSLYLFLFSSSYPIGILPSPLSRLLPFRLHVTLVVRAGVTAVATVQALSGHALAASAAIYSRRCAGRAAPAATAFRRAQASAASSPSSPPPPPPPPHAEAASLSLGGSCHRSHGVWIGSTYGSHPVSTLPPLAMPFP